MTMYTVAEANTRLDQLMVDPDFAPHVVALRGLISDGMKPAEIDFMMRGMFPIQLVTVLVDAQAAARPETTIDA